MYLRKEKGRIWKWTGCFFGLMLVFTLLSRAVYQSGIAVVQTAAPASGTIGHSVTVSGKTVQNQELAVTTVGGLRIASVQVNEGQQVKQGDVLFSLDLAYLQETILRQQQEMRKQELSIQDAWSQSNASAKQRRNAQAQAAENYDSAVSQGQVALDRAKRDLDRAKAALDGFYSGISADQAQEAQLTAAVQAAKEAYDAAVQAREALDQELAQAIQEAIAQAEAALPEPEPEPPVPEEGDGQEQPSPEEAAPAEVQSAQPQTLTQEEKSQIESALRAEYAPRLSVAEQAAAQAQAELAQAEADLEAFRQEGASRPPASEEDLKAAVERAQEAYDDALTALENAKTVYGRAVETADLPGGTSSAAQIGQITYDQMALDLEKLIALQEAEGKILAPVDGIVTGSFVQTGEKTTESTAVRLADLSQGCKFSGLVSEEQSQYIGVGDKVIIRAGNNGKLYKDLPVTTFSAGEASGGCRITVQLPAQSLALGASAELLFTKKTQPYAVCVPLSALRLDDRNQPYVLVTEEVDTVLGPQLQARKVSVTVLDQNDTTAALEEGSLGPTDQIILGSDKPVEPGTRIRVGS